MTLKEKFDVKYSAIASDIPVPRAKAGCTQSSPIRQLKIGDSFFVNRSHGKYSSSAHALAKVLNIKLSMRAETQNGVAGVRVWRIS